MNEVAVRVLEIFFRQMKQEKRDEAVLLEGITVDPAHFKNKDARIDWDVFVQFMANVGKAWPAEQLPLIGKAHLTTPLMRTFAIIPRLLFSPLELYKWWVKPDSAGAQNFACISTTLTELGPRSIILDVRITEGHTFCPEFFMTSEGGLAGMPQVLGLPSSECQMTWTETGARYRLDLPKGGGSLGFLRRIFSWPASIVGAGRALRDANDDLHRRYRELDAVRAQLDIEATKVKTAHAVSALVFRSLDVDRAITDVARALVERGGFARAEVVTQLDLGNEIVTRKAAFDSSEFKPGSESTEHTLTSRDGLESHVRLYFREGARKPEIKALEDLGEFLRPTLMMAIDNARSVLALETSRDQLNVHLEELSKARSVAEEASRLKSEFVANMSHEIRTPLNGVLGMVQLMEDTMLSKDQQDYLQMLRTSGGQLLDIVNQILDFSKFGAGSMHLDSVDFDPVTLCDDAVNAFSAEAERKDLELVCDDLYEETRMLRGDPLRLRQMLASLVSNGVKFTGSGSVEVRCSSEAVNENATKLLIEVKDTGIGMPKHVTDKMFEPFVQADGSTTRRFGGTGLGLALTKQIADLVGATIAVDSTPNQGTTFTISAFFEPATTNARSAAAQRARATLRGQHVVVLTPSEAIRTTTSRALQRLGMQTVVATTGQEAMAALETLRTSGEAPLLFLDERLSKPPEWFASALRRDPRFTRLPIVMLRLPASRPPTPDRGFADASLPRPLRTSGLAQACAQAIYMQSRAEVAPVTALRDVVADSDASTTIQVSALLIDANPVSRRVAAHVFGRAGATLDAVDDVKSAARLLEKQRFDVLVYDFALIGDEQDELVKGIDDARRRGSLMVVGLGEQVGASTHAHVDLELTAPVSQAQASDIVDRVRRSRNRLSKTA